MIYTITFSPTLDYVVEVEHFEAGMINRSISETVFPGGKGVNVSMVLHDLGYMNTALGFIAGFTGAEIRRQLRMHGVENNFIQVSRGMSRINMKIRSDQETAINGQGPVIGPEDLGMLYQRLRSLVDGDILVMAGFIPPSLPANMYEEVLAFLSGRDLKVVVDAEGELLTGTLKYHPFLIKPNADELGAIFHTEVKTRADAVPCAKILQEKGARNVLVSLGGEGAVLLTEKGELYSSPALKGEIVNTVGAGDAMIAGFLAGYLDSDGDVLYAFKEGMCAGAAKAFNLAMTNKKEIDYLMRTSEFEIEVSRI